MSIRRSLLSVVLGLGLAGCGSDGFEPVSSGVVDNDFVSCLEEDSKGGCIKEDYGFCVKEKNAWQFAAESCPAEFNSCSTFQLTDAQGTRNVAYLKNTLRRRVYKKI